MYIKEMRELFFNEKNYSLESMNELLDYSKQSYINNKIDIQFYRNVLKELYELGAFSPYDFE